MIGALLFVVMHMLSSDIDLVYKMGDTRLQSISLRRKIVFLEAVANESIKNCNMSVVDFERFARIHIRYGSEIHWIERDNSSHINMIRVTKKDSCIEKINFTWAF
ncbi:MAG: hypothetical protein LBJ59_02750 [Zoogloeaceae bacterium]|nr:hypothetical protein [Zoogloeaceae bacterium]